MKILSYIRDGNGFSLVEMLVVLAVLGLLVSIAMPTYYAMEARGRQTLCMNNLRELGKALEMTQQNIGQRREMFQSPALFLDPIHWPRRVYAENQLPAGLFMCPEDPHVAGGEEVQLLYKLPQSVGGAFVPFDDTHYQCASRRGVDEEGEPYTEYVFEDNPGWHDSRWDHGPCCGHPEYSTNDGIWRVYDKGRAGQRRVILTHFDCYWTNSLYVNGELYATDLWECLGMTIWFDDPMTSYGYNRQLDDQYAVAPDTVVLLDYKDVHVDPFDDLEIQSRLDDSGRHNGYHNVLYARGNVERAATVDLYPDIDPTPWTVADD